MQNNSDKNKSSLIEPPANMESIMVEHLAVVFDASDSTEIPWEANSGYRAGYADALAWANSQQKNEPTIELDQDLKTLVNTLWNKLLDHFSEKKWHLNEDYCKSLFTFFIDSYHRSQLKEFTEQAGPGASAILRERIRQKEVEKWTSEHDDEYQQEELAGAAACYAIPYRYRNSFILSLLWKWDWKWWKPSKNNRFRDLEKSGALIAAEIDRLLRKVQKDLVEQNPEQKVD